MSTPIDRFERRLPDSLADLAAARTPDYMIDILGQTARTRQRPAWTFLERWLPMADIARRTAFVPRLPMRAIALALAIIAILVAAGVVYVGSQRRLPAPFGPARNGLVAYAQGGSVYTVDPASSAVRTVVTGDGIAVDPTFSSDGTKLLFERRGVSNGSFVVAADVDGGRPVALSPHELLGVNLYGFSTDGRSAVISHVVDSVPTISVASTDGSTFQTLALGMDAEDPSYRPGTSDLMFVDRAATEATGIYAVRDDGTNLRPLLHTGPGTEVFGGPQWSPDGSRIAYAAPGSPNGPINVHVMSADGTGDRIVGHAPGSGFEGWPLWSPDGKRLLIERGGADGLVHPTVVSVDGGSPDVVIDHVVPDWGLMKSWSPDGAFIQVTPQEQSGKSLQQLLWNTTTGASTTAPWAATSAPTWQRTAP